VTLLTLEQAIPVGVGLLLDSTTLISYLKGNERASPVATHVVDQFVVGGRNTATVSTITVMELLVHPLRDGDDSLYRQVVLFFMHTMNLHVASVDFRVAHEAAILRASLGLKPPDALILASGRSLSVRYFVCNDHEWKRKVGSPLSRDMTVCYLEDHLPFP
jgi:predicted nucleic acid-binding protein